MRLFWPSRILRAATGKTHDWSHTLHLPKSTFPARPLPAKLEEYRQRCADDLYAWQRANRPASVQAGNGNDVDNTFILHDGPPYANGAVHVGHALNKILKDVILRTELSRGKQVQYQPGWDCHGLPIELKALQQQRSTTKKARSLKDSPEAESSAAARSNTLKDAEVREVARELATRTIEEQKKEFRQWAVMGDWDKPYKTMNKEFEIRQLEVFRDMVKKDLIFRDYRPVYWSPSSRTALAESELEYDDKHKCTAAFIKMPLVDLTGKLAHLQSSTEEVYAVIWTTTPWTLPANKAIAVKSDIQYGLYRLTNATGDPTEGVYIIGSNRTDHVQGFLPQGWTFESMERDLSGADLVSSTSGCRNSFSGTVSAIVTAGFVSDGSGTGLVHIAPGHGMEDYQLCLERGIGPAFAPVDDAGRYTSDVAPVLQDQALLAGLKIEDEGTKAVLSILRQPADHIQGASTVDLVLATHSFTHKNPVDWRTKKPVIVRSTAQWFADVSQINSRAIESLETVDFVPAAGKNRLRAFIEGRNQWCISRQRAWGVPIPVIYHKESDKENKSDEVIQHIISVLEDRGTDVWFTDAADDPAWFPSTLDPSQYIRKRDTMDVWFDSGTSWTSIQDRGGQQYSDVYVEGSDQHRGWFQSSLLTKIASQDSTASPTAPYRKLITHGFTLDGEGRKMSKSIGNVISPVEIISGSIVKSQTKRKQDPLGPDLLRLWVASCDYTKDVAISSNSIQILQQALQKYRTTMRFLLGVLQNAKSTTLDMSALPTYDMIILHRLAKSSAIVFTAYNNYKFYEGVRELNNFVNVDLSAFYFETVKDVLYTGLAADRMRTQAVLSAILTELMRWLAPVTPYLVEEIWDYLPDALKDANDEHIATMHPSKRIWDKPFSALSTDQAERSEAALDFFQHVSKAVKTAQERARADGKLGSGLACSVEISLDQKALDNATFESEQLRQALVLSELLSVPGNDEAVSSAETASSPAWLYEEDIVLNESAETRNVAGKVRVLPPTHDKCPRCWQYNAMAEDKLCTRCEKAVTEQTM